jgi:FkbM family methyltransferase
MRRLLEKLRAGFIRALDGIGMRDRARRAQERYSLSPRIRRDARDHRHFDVILSALLGPDDLCVDVGANVGTVTDTIVRCAPEAKHVLIEPLPDLAARLTERFPGCEVHAVACSDHEGHEAFTRVVERPTRSGLEPGQVKAGMTTESLTVPVTTLDRLLGSRDPRVIKIDVEGAELQVLRGARKTLGRARSVVLFEHQPPADRVDQETSALHRLLADLDYRVFDIDGVGPLTEGELVETCRTGRVWNFVATPVPVA